MFFLLYQIHIFAITYEILQHWRPKVNLLNRSKVTEQPLHIFSVGVGHEPFASFQGDKVQKQTWKPFIIFGRMGKEGREKK